MEFGASWVQTSIDGGAGSKPKSAAGRGNLGIEKKWECKLRHRGVEGNPTNPLGLGARTWQGRFCLTGGGMVGNGSEGEAGGDDKTPLMVAVAASDDGAGGVVIAEGLALTASVSHETLTHMEGLR